MEEKPVRHIWFCALIAILFIARSLEARPPDGWDWNHRSVEEPNTWSGSLEWQHGRERIAMPVLLPQQHGAGWIIALPCSAADVEIGHEPESKGFGGWTPPVALHGKLDSIGRIALATQLYPLVYDLLRPSLGWSAEVPQTSPFSERTLNGVKCSIVQLSAADLRKQVEQLGIDIPVEELNNLSIYADQAHCFVFFTIAPHEAPETQGTQPDSQTAWTLSFLSAQPILPARATGGGDTGWPDNFFMPGFWEIASAIPTQMIARQFRGGAGTHFGPTERSDAPYTRLFGQDQGTQVSLVPARGTWLRAASLADAIFSWPSILFAATLLWAAICSYVSGGLVGVIIERRWKPYARIALWNLGTIIALRIRLTRAPHPPGIASKTQQAMFTILFSMIFVGINCFLAGVFSMAFGRYAP